MSFIVKLGRDDGTREVARVHEQLASPAARQAMMKVVGVAAEQQLRAWWFKRDADSPNKMGWPRQHFWARIAKRTAFDASKTTENTATVTVADPALAAKINGATIRASGAVSPITGKPTQNIAIPMQPEAYGVWPRSGIIPGLFFIGARIGNGAYLAQRDGDRLTFFYKLVPEVTVPKDPRALPPVAELGAALGAAALSFFRRNGPSGGVGGNN